jgi:hypothetical protein
MKAVIRLGIGAVFVLVMGLMTAAVADQSINWVSVSADGTESGGSGHSAVSDNGRFVAFQSSDDLVPGYSGGTNVFVKDMQTGAVEIVSVSSNGVQANDAAGQSLDMSDDGRYVIFHSEATNLVPGDTNTDDDVFIRDRQTGSTTRVLGDAGQQGVRAHDGAISGNGRYIVFLGLGFEDGQPLTVRGVYVFDRVAGTSERVTDGVDFAGQTTYENPAISDDGRFVTFTTREFNSNEDIILFDRQTDTWKVANPRLGGVAPNSRQNDTSISGNGRFVAFGSPDSNYVAGDPAGTHDVFVYDSTSEALERIPAGGTASNHWPRPELSDSGRYVAFTFYNDTYGAANGHDDMVLYDRQTDTPEVVSVFNDGSPGDNHSGLYLYQPTISSDGRFVAFLTFTNFDAGDGGGLDVYLVDREGTTGPAPGGACTHDFSDVDGSNIFEDDICWLADQGITRGCNPPSNTEFCPKDPVTRGQMAAFLVRAFGYTDNGGGNLFTDDNGNTFEADIDRLGTAGVTRGCNPPSNTQFCPNDNVTREQMAAFLRRAFEG